MMVASARLYAIFMRRIPQTPPLSAAVLAANAAGFHLVGEDAAVLHGSVFPQVGVYGTALMLVLRRRSSFSVAVAAAVTQFSHKLCRHAKPARRGRA